MSSSHGTDSWIRQWRAASAHISWFRIHPKESWIHSISSSTLLLCKVLKYSLESQLRVASRACMRQHSQKCKSWKNSLCRQQALESSMKCYQPFHVRIQDRRQLPGTALSRQLRVQFFHHPKCQVVESNVPQIERGCRRFKRIEYPRYW